MKLKLLEINNFRAINGKNNIIQFDSDIVFVFGQNNIGKSSILHAYQYFQSPSQKALKTDFFNDSVANPIVIEATFVKEDSDKANFAEKGLDKWVSDTNEVKFRKTWTEVDKPASKETRDPQTGNFVPNGFGGLEQILTNALPKVIFIEAMPSVASLTKWLENEIKSKLLKTMRENHPKEYESALQAVKVLQDTLDREDYLGSINSTANLYFKKTFPNLEIKIATMPGKEADISKAFEKDFAVTIGNVAGDGVIGDEERLAQVVEMAEQLLHGAESSLDIGLKQTEACSARTFDLHGHGLIRQAIINILGIFKEFSENEKHIILFEEPELYLHPSNKRRFRETLYQIAAQDAYQVVCVSHDPQLIDLSKRHTSLARLVCHPSGETQIYQAGDDLFLRDPATREQVLMLNRFNPHVCEAFFADEVILVEGDTEAIVLRELLDTHYPDREVFVLNTGSKNNIPFFMEALAHFGIRQHIIHDSDERYLYKDGTKKLNKDGSPTANSAWSLNANIWDLLVLINSKNKDSAHRYVCMRNFENAHGYAHDKTKGKPYSAYEYSKCLKIDDDEKPIIQFLKQILGEMDRKAIHDQAYLEAKVIEPS